MANLNIPELLGQRLMGSNNMASFRSVFVNLVLLSIEILCWHRYLTLTFVVVRGSRKRTWVSERGIVEMVLPARATSRLQKSLLDNINITMRLSSPSSSTTKTHDMCCIISKTMTYILSAMAERAQGCPMDSTIPKRQRHGGLNATWTSPLDQSK
jgi:hypothetical protein